MRPSPAAAALPGFGLALDRAGGRVGGQGVFL